GEARHDEGDHDQEPAQDPLQDCSSPPGAHRRRRRRDHSGEVPFIRLSTSRSYAVADGVRASSAMTACSTAAPGSASNAPAGPSSCAPASTLTVTTNGWSLR